MSNDKINLLWLLLAVGISYLISEWFWASEWLNTPPHSLEHWKLVWIWRFLVPAILGMAATLILMQAVKVFTRGAASVYIDRGPSNHGGFHG